MDNQQDQVWQELPQTRKADPDQLLRFGYWLGLTMVIAALFWVSVLRGRDALQEWFAVGYWADIPFDIAAGLLLGGSFSLVVWGLSALIPAFRKIRERLNDTLELSAFEWWHVIVLALLAAIPEEIFFRGAMQPVLGLLLTALIFGALHALSSTYFLYASVAGLLLGLMVDERGSLWMAIAAHFAVDYVSLVLLMVWARSQRTEAAENLIIQHGFGIADRDEIYLDLDTPQQ